MRKPLMAGNWKMYKNAGETSSYFKDFLPLVATSTHCEIAICPPFVNLPAAVAAAGSSRVEIGAQNLFWGKEGAFTGEVSGPMLVAAGCKWVIIGHSERRQYYGEKNESVNKKTKAALSAGLAAIVCVGESLSEREAGDAESVVKSQLFGGLAGLTVSDLERIIIAYEPVWAIGTGKTATPEQAQEMHGFIRRVLAETHGADAADSLRILYGGSVKTDNIAALMKNEDVDGALVGGASLEAESFAKIVNYK